MSLDDPGGSAYDSYVSLGESGPALPRAGPDTSCTCDVPMYYVDETVATEGMELGVGLSPLEEYSVTDYLFFDPNQMSTKRTTRPGTTVTCHTENSCHP